jgi:hypothetical protein
MSLVLRITNWKIVREAMTDRFVLPIIPGNYEYRGVIASGKRKGCEVLIPKLKSFDPATLTGVSKENVTFVFQEPNAEWIKYLEANKLSISDFKF